MIFPEEFMVVRTHERSTGNTNELPAAQLTGEACELGLLEERRKDAFGEPPFVHDDEGLATREPLEDTSVLRILEDSE